MGSNLKSASIFLNNEEISIFIAVFRKYFFEWHNLKQYLIEMKKPLTTFFTVLSLLFFSAPQAQNTLTANDLSPLLGEWTGSLTYVDYSSNKPYTMPAIIKLHGVDTIVYGVGFTSYFIKYVQT